MTISGILSRCTSIPKSAQLGAAKGLFDKQAAYLLVRGLRQGGQSPAGVGKYAKVKAWTSGSSLIRAGSLLSDLVKVKSRVAVVGFGIICLDSLRV
jgi:hypothetical protein